MNQQLDAAGGCDPAAQRREARHRGRDLARGPSAVLGDDGGHGRAARRRARAPLRHGRRRRRHPAEHRGGGRRAGFLVERGIVVDDQMRALDDQGTRRRVRRRRVRPAPRPGLRAGRAAVGAGAGARRPPHRRRPAARVPRLAHRDEAQGRRRRRRRRWASRRPSVPTTTTSSFSEPRRGVYKSVVVRDDRLVGATLRRRPRARSRFLMQAFDRGLPLPEERVALLFDLGAPPRRGERRGAARRDAQVCNCNGVSKGDDRGVRPRRRRRRRRRHGRDPRRQGLRLVQVARRADRRVGRRRRRSRWTRPRPGTCPASRYAKPELVARDPRAGPALGVGGVRRARARRRRRTPSARWG